MLSWLTGVSIASGLLVLLRGMQIPFFLYYPTVTDTILISQSLDQYTFLITSLCIPATFATYDEPWRNKIRSSLFMSLVSWIVGVVFMPFIIPYGLSLMYLAVVILGITIFMRQSKGDETSEECACMIVGATSVIALIECASAYYWVTAAFIPQTLFGVASQDLETSLTYATYPIAPILLLIIMCSWIWVPILSRRARRFPSFEPNSHIEPKSPDRALSNRRLLFLALDVLAILSVLVFYFLYAAGQLWVVGVDSQYRYVIPLTSFGGLGFFQAFEASLGLGHGVYLALLLMIKRLTQLSPFLIVKYAPLVLTFFTSVFSFLAFRNVAPRDFAFLTGICTILWLPTTIGIWSGIQANWSAYLVWMFFLVFYFNQRGVFTRLTFVVQSLLSLCILVFHPWTWGVFLATVVLTFLIGIRRGSNNSHGLTVVVSAVWLAALVGIGAFISLSGVRGDIINAFTLYELPLRHVASLFMLFPGAWSEMWKVWSSFLSPTLILVALVGAFAVSELQGETKRYMLAWVAIWCIGSILVAPIDYVPANPALSETQLWRMLYLSPLPVLLALGVSKCVHVSSRFVLSLSDSSRYFRSGPVVLCSVIAAFSLPLFLFSAPIIRLSSLIAGTLAVGLLVYRFQLKDAARTLVIVVLLLIIVNAAFRSLFPLLLDPHNLYPTSSI